MAAAETGSQYPGQMMSTVQRFLASDGAAAPNPAHEPITRQQPVRINYNYSGFQGWGATKGDDEPEPPPDPDIFGDVKRPSMDEAALKEAKETLLKDMLAAATPVAAMHCVGAMKRKW